MNCDGYVKYTVDDYVALEKSLHDRMIKFIKKGGKNYIYGAGLFGRRMLFFLERHGDCADKISGFIVTDKEGNPDIIKGKKVFCVKDVDLIDAGVILALGVEHHGGLLAKLKECNCSNILSFESWEYNHMFWCNHQLSSQIVDKYREYWAPRINCKYNISDWKHVLIICIDRIGEVILNIPFIRELHRNLNYNTKITLVIRSPAVQFMELCPYVDDIIVYNGREYIGEYTEDSIHKSKLFADRYFRTEGYDVAFITGWHNIDIEGLFLAVFSRARLRIGFSEHNMSHKEFCNMNFDKFLSLPIKSVSIMHDVERALSLVTTMGGDIKSNCLEIWTKEQDAKYAENFFMMNHLSKYRVIAIVPHALDEARMWDWHRYAELIDVIGMNFKKVFFLLLGGEDSNMLCNKITEYCKCNRVIDLSGKTNLRQVAEILRLCTIYIGADTGLAHIAAAVNLPTIEIVCHSREGDPLEYPAPERYRPWGNKSYIVRPEKALPGCGATCYKRQAHCINQISVHDVMSVARKALKTTGF